jgi:hypothetical protein
MGPIHWYMKPNKATLGPNLKSDGGPIKFD